MSITGRAALSFMSLFVALSLVACGGDDEGGTVTRLGTPEAEGDPTAVVANPGETQTEVAVTLAEWSVTLPVAEAPAGVIEFVATNAGSEQHELVVIRSDDPADELEVEVGDTVEEDEVDFRGEIGEFDPGSTVSGSFRLEAGRYLLICNIPGHYQNGMVAEFIVQ